jgi:hypothetical protein
MKQEIDIIREPHVSTYENGNTCIFNTDCDICGKPNYPVFTWCTADDPYISAHICFECATEMMHQNST